MSRSRSSSSVSAWSLGGKPGIGTVANALLVGSFIQLFTAIHGVAQLAHYGLATRIPLLVAASFSSARRSAFYIGADLGAGPRDTLMLVGARRTRFRIGIVRATLSCAHSVPASHWAAPSGRDGALRRAGRPHREASFAVLARTPIAIPSPDPVPVGERRVGKKSQV